MARAMIKSEFLAVFMESSLYFTGPLLRRIEIPNFFLQRSVHYHIYAYRQHLIDGTCSLKLWKFDKSTNN
jgi:hypothetical protein